MGRGDWIKGWKYTRLVVLAVVLVAGVPPPLLRADLLDQGWSDQDKARWHGATQGSRLIPYDWFKALEQPDADGLFLEAGYIARFHYLPGGTGNLPLGFVLDATKDDQLSRTRLRWKVGQGDQEKWVGMTCAACHTGKISFQQHAIQVEGAPTGADFQSFFDAFLTAVTATHDDVSKFERFAQRVLGPKDGDANRKLLRDALATWLAFETSAEKPNHTALRYGYARLDAVGRIFNRVVAAAALGEKGNAPDAPVSYPFIWNVPQHDKVQWNGIAANSPIGGVGGQPFDIGALGRNTGEVIGVFADIKPNTTHGLHGFESSINVSNLVAIEQLLGRLRPPKWPSEILKTPDATLVARGRELFLGHCERCHTLLGRTDLKTPIKAHMGALRQVGDEPGIGTDIWMACNAFADESASGVLEGTPRKYFTGDKLGKTARLSDMLTVMIAGALTNQKGTVVGTAAASFFGLKAPPVVVGLEEEEAPIDVRAALRHRCLTDDSPLLAYKGRPLTGIWATAPYLHNGSVPTLDDVLRAPADRPKRFWVGTREFDPVKVGFVTTPTSSGNTFEFRTEDDSGNAIDGNSNAGHDYGNAQFDDDARRALVEFMKTL